jgi:hypothetical protein
VIPTVFREERDMLARSDFRRHKVPAGYKVSQRVGGGRELLSAVYATKAAASKFIRDALIAEGEEEDRCAVAAALPSLNLE